MINACGWLFVRRVCLAAALALCVVARVGAELGYSHDVSVSAQGVVSLSGSLTVDQAEQAAINRARMRAIEQAAGVTVTAAHLLEDNLATRSFLNTLSRGFIVSEKILTWDWHAQWLDTAKRDQPPVPVLAVTLDCVVRVPEKSFFRQNAIEATLNKQTFMTGEKVGITVLAHNDVNVLIVNYAANGAIIPVFPNNYSSDSHWPEGTRKTVPGAKEGYSIEVVPLEGQDVAVEAFLIFAFSSNDQMKAVSLNDYFPAGVHMEYALFYRKLTELPIEWMSQKILIYTVR